MQHRQEKPYSAARSRQLTGSVAESAPLAGVSCSVDEPFFDTGTFSRSQNSRGNHVQSLQWHLKEWGYLGTIDGIYGPNTEAAVAAFQQEAGITVDGIVGPETQGALCTAVENWHATGEPFPNGGGWTGPGNGGSGGGNGDGQQPGAGAFTGNWPYYAAGGAVALSAIVYAARS